MPTLRTLTGNADAFLGGDHVPGLKVYLEHNLPAGQELVDLTNGKVLLGKRKQLSLNGTGSSFSVTPPGTDSTDLNVEPGTLQYQIVMEYPTGGGRPTVWRSGWFSLTGNADISDPELVTTVTPVVANTAGALIAEMEALRDQAADIVGLTDVDDAAALAVDDETSDLYAALVAGFARGQVVTHPRWGAAPGNTAAVNNAAIQGAIDFVGTQGGGIVYVPAGVYAITGLTYANGLRLVGAGMGATKLVLDPAETGGILAGLMGTIGSTGEPITDLVVEDITFDGNQANSTAAGVGLALLHFYSAGRVTCRRARFANGVGYGVGIEGHLSNASADKQGPSTDVLFESCEFIDNGYYQGGALSADGIDIKDCERVTFINCRATGNSDKGFNPRGRHVSMLNCYASGNATGYDFNSHNDPGAGFAQDTYAEVFGCTAEGNTGSGFAATATENSVTHVLLDGCKGLGNGTNGAQASVPPLTGKVRLTIKAGHYKRNGLYGIYAEAADEFRVYGASVRNNADDGIRVTNQAGATFDAVRSTANGGVGLQTAGTSTSIDVYGGNYAGNTGAGLAGSGLRLRGNPGGGIPNITAAANIDLTARVRPLVAVAGATTITSLTATFAGDMVTLKFDSTAQVTDGGNLNLAGNFTGGAGRTLTLACDGTNWYEVARTTP